jgi:hypothetical protein
MFDVHFFLAKPLTYFHLVANFPGDGAERGKFSLLTRGEIGS